MERLKKGHILIAEPFLGDPNFDRSVVLLTEHNSEGTVGYILNKPADVQIDFLTDKFSVSASPIFKGGPVENDLLGFIHTRPDLISSSVKVSEQLHWSGELEELKFAIENELITPTEVRFFLGYSGWGEGQLEAEMKEKAWIVLESSQLDFLNIDPSELWKTAMTKMGKDHQLWANAPSDPLLN